MLNGRYSKRIHPMTAEYGLCSSLRRFSAVFFLAILFVFSMPFAVAHAAEAKEPKVYHMPPSKIQGVIEKTKGKKRALFIWKSTDRLSQLALPEYSTLEQANPGSIISISLDSNPLRLTQYLKSIGETNLKTLVVKPTTGQSLNKVLEELGVKLGTTYPLVVVLDENNTIKNQGRLYIDFVADYLLSESKLPVRPR